MDAQRLRKSPNIAIVGSTSLLGKELREMLEDRGFPVGKLALLETEEYAGLLQEFAGDIRITQVISPDAFDDIDITFFACGPDIMQSYIASGSRFPELTIDMTQAGRAGTVYLHGLSDVRLLRAQGYFVSPHPAAIVIARILSSLHGASVAEWSAVTVIEPASERGNAGVEELQAQTVNLLNFQEIDNKVFGGQLAFNILAERAASERSEGRILEHLESILGKTFPRPTISAIQAPVFHSHAFSFFVQVMSRCTVAELSAEIERNGGTIKVHTGGDDPSPVRVAGTDTIHVGRISQSPGNDRSFSLWVVADNLRVAASNAIQMAEHIMLAPALDR